MKFLPICPLAAWWLSCLLMLPTDLTGQESPSGQNSPTGIDYTVDLGDALNHYMTVDMTARPSGPRTEVMMATWTPGSYLVREYARHVDRVTVVDGQGQPLDIEKISKNRWAIETPDPSDAFTLSYRVYCNESSVRTNFVSRSHAVLNGAPSFITIPDQMDSPHRVRLKLPAALTRSASCLLPASDDPHHYRAANFDELVDSPVVAGNVELFPFVVAGVEHYLVNVNDRGQWDGMRAARDLAKIVTAHHEVWGNVPYDRYYFLNIVGGGGGGLEHDNCCLMMSGRYAMREDRSYQRWLSLASHEFFHTWNVRRLRPRSLVQYDYESEVYTPSLWIAEGITSYYEDLLLVRAGLTEQKDFLNTLGSLIRRVQTRSGRKEQSLRDSSHDAWIKYYRQSSNSGDTQISYYTKGAVVALLLDARIRAASDGQKSLDDAMRRLYKNHAGAVGYQPGDFRDICSQVAGADLSDWFVEAVDSTEELDYQELADWFGLEIGDIRPVSTGSESGDDASGDDASGDDASGDDTSGKKKREPVRWIGIGESDSPATRAGLSDSDELIAINGIRLTGGLKARLQEFEVGDPIEILISRDDQIEEVLLTVASRPATPNWGLKVSKQATELQTSRLNAWAGVTREPELVADTPSETVADKEEPVSGEDKSGADPEPGDAGDGSP